MKMNNYNQIKTIRYMGNKNKLLDFIIPEIIKHSNKDDIVLDNCMGSGSTGVACVNTNRRFIGIEKEEKYFEISKDRLLKAWREKYGE